MKDKFKNINKTKNQLPPFILSVLILSFLTAYFILAWDDPYLAPPLGNVDAPINIGPFAQIKSGALTVDTLTTSGGVLYLSDLSEGNIERVAEIIGYNDLFLLSNPDEDGSIEIGGSELNFWSDGLKWQIDSIGILTIGSVPWERLIDFSDDCPENEYIIGMNEDGTFKCGFGYCEIIYKCAVPDGEGGCIPKAEGEYDLQACQKCDGINLDPVNYAANTQDTTGPNICDNTLGDCYACNINGNCSFQTSDSDTGGQCPKDNCSTGNCSGTGYSCGTYTNGQHDCDLCMKCNPNGDGSCVYQTSGEDLGDECFISTCTNGLCSGIGSSCQGYTDYKEVSGCNGVCYGCYSGECITMNNQKDAYGESQCIDIHYGCESGVCANPQIDSGCRGYLCGGCMYPACTTCYINCSNSGYDGCRKGYTELGCSAGSTWCGNPSSQSCICWNWKYD